jgi:glycerol-3-phosphate dehydrogenase
MSSESIDFRNRDAIYTRLESTQFDLLVIGAGITGCGVARDAAMRGMSVALVDARDIASGTSSRSSKLIHGGMRYMAAGQLTVVKEAAIERKTLRRIAPHLAQETSMLLPAPSLGAVVKLKAAMLAYETLGEVAKADRHVVWSLDELREREPTLITDRLVGAVVYPEYVTDDARLTLANTRSAKAAGAEVLTYAPVTEILTENGVACGALIGDAIGDSGARVQARMVINAAGPWLDAVRALENSEAPPMLQLTKGIHVVLKRERLPIQHTVIMQAPDKRSNFVVPRGDFVYFGTTDTFYPDAEYNPSITREDIAYLMDVGSKAFVEGPFNDDDIVSLWSGVRPLLAQRGKKPSEISRKNEILRGPSGVLSIAGGKLTSYRSMAERIVDECETSLGMAHQNSRTADETLPGGDCTADLESVVSELVGTGCARSEAERVARLYGSEAADAFKSGVTLEAEVSFAVAHEGACTLEDFWVRRSSRAHFETSGGLESIEPSAEIMAEMLNWSPTETLGQIEQCRVIRETEMQLTE